MSKRSLTTPDRCVTARQTPRSRGVAGVAIASFALAILFAAVSLFLPPEGVIDGSVLILVAQLLLLCATFLGVGNYVNLISNK